jgi:hypothetical protein
MADWAGLYIVNRANLDGSNSTTILHFGSRDARALFVSENSDQIFIGNLTGIFTATPTSNGEYTITEIVNVTALTKDAPVDAITADISANLLCFATGKQIFMGALDGTGVELISKFNYNLTSKLIIDSANSYVYVVAWDFSTLMSWIWKVGYGPHLGQTIQVTPKYVRKRFRFVFSVTQL